MPSQQKQSKGYINPYRSNPRNFSKYFHKKYQKLNESLHNDQMNIDFLENVSKTQTIRIRESMIESCIQKLESQKRKTDKFSFVIRNQRVQNNYLQNPQLLNLVSKHIQPSSKVSKTKLSLYKQYPKSPFPLVYTNKSLGKLESSPKITEFMRQTFYLNSSNSKELSSRKQIQDQLHSGFNLSKHKKRISLYKITKPHSSKSSFVTYELYLASNRLAIQVQIIGAILSQIKFRLVFNQQDTKTFNQYWKNNLDQFVEKCLHVSKDGISLKVKNFNSNNQIQSQFSKTNDKIKIYLKKSCQSVVKKQITRKNPVKKIGNCIITQQYENSFKLANDIKNNSDSRKQKNRTEENQKNQIAQQQSIGSENEKQLHNLEVKIQNKSQQNKIQQTEIVTKEQNIILYEVQPSQIKK